MTRRRLLGCIAAIAVALSLPVDADEPALVQAAERGDLAAVRKLLDTGTPVDTRDSRRRTPLLAATHANRVAVAKLLIERGADVNAKDDIQDSPYLYAEIGRAHV